MSCLGLVGWVLVALPGVGPAGIPVFPEPPLAEQYGQVVLGELSEKAGVPPVVFDHWRHRPMFSCRPCHADLGFAMKAGASGISRATNAGGLHCGGCHDGKAKYRGEPIFAACSGAGPFESRACSRCHSAPPGPRAEYAVFTEKLPRSAGRFVDWEESEARGLVSPLDFVEGISFRRDGLRIDADVPLQAKGTWLGNVTFSHRKHALWNGCEACHPDIFPSTRRGAAAFDMTAVRSGKYCGVCHGVVAFPLVQCLRCHEGMGSEGP